MAERRHPTDPKGMREEVGSLAKKDPRRESTGPSLFIGLLQEVQRELQALKERMTELETALAEERQARLSEIGVAVPVDKPGDMHRRATKNLKIPSAPPPARKSTRPPPSGRK